jgi:hypothetical protein
MELFYVQAHVWSVCFGSLVFGGGVPYRQSGVGSRQSTPSRGWKSAGAVDSDCRPFDQADDSRHARFGWSRVPHRLCGKSPRSALRGSTLG